MKYVRLLVDVHYPAAWVMTFPPFRAGTVVPVIRADNIPQNSPDAIRYWIDTPELQDDAYGVGLRDGDFVEEPLLELADACIKEES